MPSTPQRLLLPAMVALTLAGCGHSDDEHRTETETATISFSGINEAGGGGIGQGTGQSVSVVVPGFAAKFNVPDLALGGADTTIDGIRLHPGSRIGGMRISGAAGDGSGGEERGTVEMRFTDPTPPDQLLAYYKQSAKAAGWTEIPPAAGQQFAATKSKGGSSEHLAMQIGIAGAGSTGRFLISGN